MSFHALLLGHLACTLDGTMSVDISYTFDSISSSQCFLSRTLASSNMTEECSWPAMPAFMLSAPGKVILFGEHAAVYGRPAIAAAISLRSYLLVNTLPPSQRIVTLDFVDIELKYTWQIATLPWDAFRQSNLEKSRDSHVEGLDPSKIDAIREHVQAAVPDGVSDEQRKIHQQTATAFLYMFLSLSTSESPGFIYTLRSTIPTGAGLGSSASVCVCLSAALLLQTNALARPRPGESPKKSDEETELINRWAFVGEQCIHGDPSGIDNTVSTRGKAVGFQKQNSGHSSVTSLANFPKLPLLLVDSKQSRSTSVQVDKVKSRRQSHHTETETILDKIGKLTVSAMKLISLSNSDSIDAATSINSLGDLTRRNHEALVSLGVSHPRIERICALANEADIGWTKLTGAGGGGCAITILRPDVDKVVLEALVQRLTVEGYEVHQTLLGADGVGVLHPAVISDGSVYLGDSFREHFRDTAGTRFIEEVEEGFRGKWLYYTETTVFGQDAR